MSMVRMQMEPDKDARPCAAIRAIGGAETATAIFGRTESIFVIIMAKDQIPAEYSLSHHPRHHHHLSQLPSPSSGQEPRPLAVIFAVIQETGRLQLRLLIQA